MKVLDLFAGLGGWSAAFAARGDDVVTTEAVTRDQGRTWREQQGVFGL